MRMMCSRLHANMILKRQIVFFCSLCNILFVLGNKQIINNGVTKEQKKEIVELHNHFRLQIALGKVANQPKAADMMELCWDEGLAKSAQIIADKMIFKHDIPDDDRFIFVGQNLAESSSTGRKPDDRWSWAITDWFNEVERYNYSSPFNKKTGHYTQVVWAKTRFVGCGRTSYENTEVSFKYRVLFVCNYGPGGNIRGVKPYKVNRCGCSGLCKQRCDCKPKMP